MYTASCCERCSHDTLSSVRVNELPTVKKRMLLGKQPAPLPPPPGHLYYYTGSSITAAVLLTYTRGRQLVYGTPVQLLHAQTEPVAYKPTLARPSARNSLYGIGGG